MFEEVNIESVSYVSQRPVGGIEKHVRTCVILWPYPLPFQDSPKRFCNVQMWGIWRKEEEEKSSLFPYRPDFLYPPVPMHCGIVKHDKGISADAEGKVIKKTDYLLCRHPLSSGESFILVLTGYHTKDIEPCNSLGGNKDIFSFQLPPVWHIPFRTGMALVGVVERDTPLTCLIFKFLQLLDLVLVELRRGYSPWAFPYTLISCANADKKRLKVMSLAALPVACSQAAFALLTHCLSCLMARRTIPSSEESMMGFRPRPGRVFSPSMPSSLYRLTHAFTDTKLISVCAPAFAAERPSAFRRTARQRIRKQCFSPLRKPLSSSRRCASVNSNTFAFPITNNRTRIAKDYFV
mgnify:CR=1 FL=1